MVAGAYVIARAVRVPLTYDEATTLVRFVDTEPSAFADFAVATNHLLNTVLTRGAHTLVGSAPWALRLPNVLAGLAYLAVAVRFAGRTTHATIGAAGAVLLATNPYLLDYLALSRGYGLAAALLAGSWLCWLRWWDRPPALGGRDLVMALGLSAAAVAASYSVLPAFLALVAITAGRLAWQSRGAPRADGSHVAPIWSWRTAVGWALLATMFTTLVFTREHVLSAHAYAPTTVRIAGLFPHETRTIQVFRHDSTGRLRPLVRRQDGTWYSGPVDGTWTLRVLMPAAADRNLALLEVKAGDAIFARTRQTPGPWQVQDVGDIHVLTSTDALRWHGDAAHRRFVATHTAATMTTLSALVAALMLAARSATRRRMASTNAARALVWSIVAVASLAGAPLYLLRRDEQLFFGGSTGIVADTLGSLVRGTAYGIPVGPAVIDLAAWALPAALILPLVLVGVVVRSRGGAAFRAAAVMASLLALCVALTIALHELAAVPYPIGRTALYLMPLYLVGLVLAADALAMLGPWWRRGVTTALALLAAGSLWHAMRAGNLSHAFDWPGDSAVPAMLQEVIAQRAATQASPGPLRVGVDWPFYPTARYYASRLPADGVQVDPIVLPGDGLPLAFAYGPPEALPRGGRMIARHPVSAAELHRYQR